MTLTPVNLEAMGHFIEKAIEKRQLDTAVIVDILADARVMAHDVGATGAAEVLGRLIYFIEESGL